MEVFGESTLALTSAGSDAPLFLHNFQLVIPDSSETGMPIDRIGMSLRVKELGRMSPEGKISDMVNWHYAFIQCAFVYIVYPPSFQRPLCGIYVLPT